MNENQKKQISEYLKKINDILEGQLEDRHDEKHDKVFRVKYGVEYWYLSDAFEILRTKDFKSNLDDRRYFAGNYFNTNKQCELYSAQQNEWWKLKSMADSDIEKKECFYCISYGRNLETLLINLWSGNDIFGLPIFASQESAKKALDSINHDLIIGYIKRGL
jgi:hypothetical protein